MDDYTSAAIWEANNCWDRGYELGVYDVQHLIDDTCTEHTANDDDFRDGLAAAEEASAEVVLPCGYLSPEENLHRDADPMPPIGLDGPLLNELTTLLARITDHGRTAGRTAYAEAIRDYSDNVVADIDNEVSQADRDPDLDDEDRAATHAWAKQKLAGYEHMLTTICTRLEISLTDP